MGSLDDLCRWAEADFHLDFTDEDLVMSLAANAIATGVWRNNTEVENIHAGCYKRPGMREPRGLSDAEMMLGNIETARLIRDAFEAEANGSPHLWWQAVEQGLFDYDRPYPTASRTPLTAHVTKKVLAQNTRMVKKQMNWMMMAEDLVGRERFLRGVALCALDHTHYGTPMWDDTVDAWVEETIDRLHGLRRDRSEDPTGEPWRPNDEVVAMMRTDPTGLDVEVIEACLHSGLWGASGGDARWHQRHCGQPSHHPSSEVVSFTGMFASLAGLPQAWLYALATRPR